MRVAACPALETARRYLGEVLLAEDLGYFGQGLLLDGFEGAVVVRDSGVDVLSFFGIPLHLLPIDAISRSHRAATILALLSPRGLRRIQGTCWICRVQPADRLVEALFIIDALHNLELRDHGPQRH